MASQPATLKPKQEMLWDLIVVGDCLILSAMDNGRE